MDSDLNLENVVEMNKLEGKSYLLKFNDGSEKTLELNKNHVKIIEEYINANSELASSIGYDIAETDNLRVAPLEQNNTNNPRVAPLEQKKIVSKEEYSLEEALAAVDNYDFFTSDVLSKIKPVDDNFEIFWANYTISGLFQETASAIYRKARPEDVTGYNPTSVKPGFEYNLNECVIVQDAMAFLKHKAVSKKLEEKYINELQNSANFQSLAAVSTDGRFQVDKKYTEITKER